MASEDLFGEDFSEEIISELEQDYIEADIIAAKEQNEDQTEEDDVTDANLAEETQTGAGKTQDSTTKTSNEARLFQLPLTRIRNIMKLDPDLNVASNEAVFLVTRATELFIQSLAVESYTFTAQAKKKTVQKRDVDLAISAVDSLMFLDGAMTF